jgi:hypothetical protein
MARKRIKIASIILIVLGVLALVVGRISYTIHREMIVVGPQQVPLETRKVIPLRPLGVLSILGGLTLIAASRGPTRSRAR